MKKYNLREAIIDLLLRIDRDSGYSHLLIDHEINSRKISPKDGALLTEIVYGTIQRKMTLDYYLDAYLNNKKKIQPWVYMLLRMSIYQMVFLDKVPDHAVIHEAVEIGKERGHKGIASFVNGVLRNFQRKGIPDMSDVKCASKRLSIETSHPEWLINRWVDMYGFETTKAMCHANLTRKPLSIRVQPLKITREKVMDELTRLGFEIRQSPLSDQGIIIDKGNILHTDLFKEGYVTIQDQSSMLAGDMLQAEPGMEVLDACSAPGGKATHIAETMENQGFINAYDLHQKKVRLIKEKAMLLDLTIIEANQGDARKLQQVHKEETFDRILIDAPCSGLGVIRGKPDIKYNKTEKDIHQLTQIQSDILDEAAPLLKKGGLLIYSTCTVDTSENNEVVHAFLEQHPEFQIDQSLFEDIPGVLSGTEGCTDAGVQLFPQTLSTDGFFLTRFIKT
ncbi:16S rRNA (cytosine(967)-C(5))-methyltransferase RsmB [Virgibacillus siamensis]|uniref:16S rRNA (cytosine(967)-C(5))-methyltransferase RsmB n=1 Tax=Virgibacillus siamensis TaxID=480071 RepID=UPI000985F2CD|nr:16S rRNA (cytosine(967)-C(5))-methyltransferase RsmB [Virgibacillus siamensis]